MLPWTAGPALTRAELLASAVILLPIFVTLAFCWRVRQGHDKWT